MTKNHRLGVPYQAWRISHAKHHASTSHVTQEQVYVARTRAELGLRPLGAPIGDEEPLDGVALREETLGSRVRAAISKELWEAVGDSPIGAVFMPMFGYLVCGVAHIGPSLSHLSSVHGLVGIHFVERFGTEEVPHGDEL